MRAGPTPADMRCAARLVLVPAIAALCAGCISGRVLTGYPGYPFASFETSVPVDSAFFRLQPAVEAEGFALDYTILDEGFITTRSSELAGRPVFLNLVVESRDGASDASGAEGPLRTKVWIAAYEETVTGAERINPLQGDAWSSVMEVASRLSASVDGTPPIGPVDGSDPAGD